MRNILIPIDFTSISISALDYALLLFESIEVEFHLLTIYISRPSKLLGSDYNAEWFGEMDNDATSEIENLVKRYNQKSSANHNFNSIVKSDSIVNAVKVTTISKSIDLVITGTRGVSSTKGTFIGTNSLRIINTINACPIIVVPGGYQYTNVNRIVFSTDFKRPFQNKELNSIIQLATLKNATVQVVYVSNDSLLTENQQKNKEVLQEHFKGLVIEFTKLERGNSLTQTIENHTENTKCELLALIHHKHHFFHQLTRENVIKKASFRSKIPLLILPEIQ